MRAYLCLVSCLIVVSSLISCNGSGGSGSNTAPLPLNSHELIYDSGTRLDGSLNVRADTDISGDGILDMEIRTTGTSSVGPSITYYSGADYSRLWQYSTNVNHDLSVVSTSVDLDGDGQPEILVLDDYYDDATMTLTGTLVIYGAVDRSLKWQKNYSVTLPSEGASGWGYSDASVGDMDGDGVYEIILKQNAGYALGNGAYGYDKSVKVLKGPDHHEVYISEPLRDGYLDFTDDIDGDGITDWSIATSESSIAYYKVPDFSLLWKFTADVNHHIRVVTTKPVDLDGDGQPDVLVLDDYYDDVTRTATQTLYIYNVADHSLKWQKTYNYTLPAGSTSGSVHYDVSVADLDGDGVYEIVLFQGAGYTSGSARSHDKWVKVLKGSSHTVVYDSGPLPDDFLSWGNFFDTDINSDGITDLSITTSGTSSVGPSITYYKGTDFSPLWQFSADVNHAISLVLARTSEGQLAPVDLDGDGQPEVLVVDQYYDDARDCLTGTLYSYSVADHSLKWQKTFTYAFPVGSTTRWGYYFGASVADINGDGVYEIILSQNAQYISGGTHSYNGWVKVLK